jgi:uncharacterized protein YceH (UPF0502 family)
MVYAIPLFVREREWRALVSERLGVVAADKDAAVQRLDEIQARLAAIEAQLVAIEAQLDALEGP